MQRRHTTRRTLAAHTTESDTRNALTADTTESDARKAQFLMKFNGWKERI